jgi:hypothetical protein
MRTYGFSNEALFTLSGYVNNQCNRHKNTEDPLAVLEVPLQDLKVGIWCAVSAEDSYFHETVSSGRYVRSTTSRFIS